MRSRSNVTWFSTKVRYQKTMEDGSEKVVTENYKKFNINVTADDIIITSGGSEAVLFSFMSCLNPGGGRMENDGACADLRYHDDGIQYG